MHTKKVEYEKKKKAKKRSQKRWKEREREREKRALVDPPEAHLLTDTPSPPPLYVPGRARDT